MNNEDSEHTTSSSGERVHRRRRSKSRKSRWNRECWGIRIFKFRRCHRSRFYGVYCRDCIWQPMLALTTVIALLIVIPNGRWRDLVRPIAPGFADIGLAAEGDQLAGGADFGRGQNGNDKPRLELPAELPKLRDEQPEAETIPLRTGF